MPEARTLRPDGEEATLSPSTALREELEWALEPLTAAVRKRRDFDALLYAMGWNPQEFDGGCYGRLVESLGGLDQTINGAGGRGGLVNILLEFEGIDDFDAWKALVTLIKDDLLPLVRGGLGVIDDLRADQSAGLALADDLIGYLIARYLHRRSTLLFDVLVVLDVIRPPTDPPSGRIPEIKSEDLVSDGEPKVPDPPLRYSRRAPVVDLGRLARLLSGDGGLLDPYSPEGEQWRWPKDRREAMRVKELLFPRLGAIAWDLNWEAHLLSPRVLPESLLADDPRLSLPMGQLSVAVLSQEPEAGEDGLAGQVGFHLQLVSPMDSDDGLPCFWLQPTGSLGYCWSLGAVNLALSVAADVPALVLGPAGAEGVGSGWALRLAAGTGSATMEAALTSANADGPALRIGRAEGSRIEIGSWGAGLFVEVSDEGWDLGIRAQMESGLIVLRAPDDGFLGSILPPEGIRGAFGFVLRWTLREGLSLEGGLGLSLEIPIEKTILGVLTVHTLSLKAGVTATDGAWSFGASAGLALSTTLGPMLATVDRMGVQTIASSDRQEVSFLAPTGVGLALSAPGLSGGGFLKFEADRYSGLMHIDVQDLVAVTIYGVLDTKYPDGSKGFALLGLIFAELSGGGVQLGFGFTLLGVGGLFGINRGFDTDALIDLFRSGDLDALCFPEHPVEDAPAVFAALNAVFPAEKDRYVFGPFVKLGWGPGPLITLSVGVLVTLPEPILVVILGQLDLLLPTKAAPIVEIHCNVLGILDLGQGYFQLEARLRDSKLLKLFPLTGGMFLLTKWSDPPEFIFAVGGFHPRFPRPEGVPDVPRLGTSIVLNPITRLEIDGYFAITSNSFQLGAAADLYAGAGGIDIHGWLSFDALVYFDPFHFEVDISAGIEVLAFTLSADVHLSGPNPWHVSGAVTINLGLACDLPFDETFGEALPDAAAPDPDPVPLLEAELTKPACWASVGADAEVLLAQGCESALAPHRPLQLRQRVLPLDTLIERLHERDLAQPVSLSLIVAAPFSASATTLEWFAPGQHQILSELGKLSEPSFVRMKAGLVFEVESDAPDGHAFQLDHEDILVPPEGAHQGAPKAPKLPPFALPGAALTRLRRPRAGRSTPQLPAGLNHG